MHSIMIVFRKLKMTSYLRQRVLCGYMFVIKFNNFIGSIKELLK
jgi:hypothetical protein